MDEEKPPDPRGGEARLLIKPVVVARQGAPVCWISVPAGSQLLQQGFGVHSCAVVYSKDKRVLFSLAHCILERLAPDIASEVRILNEKCFSSSSSSLTRASFESELPKRWDQFNSTHTKRKVLCCAFVFKLYASKLQNYNKNKHAY